MHLSSHGGSINNFFLFSLFFLSLLLTSLIPATKEKKDRCNFVSVCKIQA